MTVKSQNGLPILPTTGYRLLLPVAFLLATGYRLLLQLTSDRFFFKYTWNFFFARASFHAL
jgi:hypothetical protein